MPNHYAGPAHFVKGGIISTLIDRHSVRTAPAAGDADEIRAIGNGLACVLATSKLDVDYRRAAPMNTVL